MISILVGDHFVKAEVDRPVSIEHGAVWVNSLIYYKGFARNEQFSDHGVWPSSPLGRLVKGEEKDTQTVYPIVAPLFLSQ
jgi:hypothetical protein